MNSDELTKPSIPITYGSLTVQLAVEHGISRERLLEGSGVTPEMLEEPGGRISLQQWGLLISRSLKLTGEPGLAYEYGLRNNLATHGFFGYGLISNLTGREALQFAVKYARLRTLAFDVDFFTEGPQVVIDTRERIHLGPIREYAIDMYLVAWARTIQQCLPSLKSGLELHFERSEPRHFAAYRDRLPTTYFGAGGNQIRFPVEYLDYRFDTADPVTARQIDGQCNRELELLGSGEDILLRARSLLVNAEGEYRNLTELAALMRMSSRTLKRKLQRRGVSFQQLLDEARGRDSKHMLKNSTMTVEAIAAHVGYSDPANFTRAFRKWTGQSPSDYRRQAADP